MQEIQVKILKYKLYLLPTLAICSYFLYKSIAFNLHDFGNSYFPALMLQEGLQPEKIVFDIYDFNQFAWHKNYKEVLLDYYLNSPFCTTFLYPFVILSQKAYLAKFFFNIVSIILFIFSLEILSKSFKNSTKILVLFLPFLFFVPIQNNILFGQFYLIIFAFTVISYHFYSKKQFFTSTFSLGIVIFLKIFPSFYCIPLLINAKKKYLLFLLLSCSILFIFSVFINGFSFWKVYLFEKLPTAFLNESSIGFQTNVQSFDVFFKHLFIKDDFHNPKPFYDSLNFYYLSVFLTKSLILGFGISFIISNKNDVWKALSCIIIILFLLQTRTPTYSLVLWIIPLTVFINSSQSIIYKIIFCILLFFGFNFSFENLPFFLKFSRLWIILGLAFLFYKSEQKSLKFTYFLSAFFVFSPMILSGILKDKNDKSVYVLPNQGQFITYDFGVENGKLVAFNLTKNGNKKMFTSIFVESFDSLQFEIKKNQISRNNTIIELHNSMKKKAILVNKNELYFLTDHHSRVGWFNLKKIVIEK